MTRKHFDAIAHALRVTRPEPQNPNNVVARATWEATARRVAGVLGEFNPGFKLDRFLVAAGVQEK